MEVVKEEPLSRSSWWNCYWKHLEHMVPLLLLESWSPGRTCRQTWRGWVAATLSSALKNVPLWSSRRWRLLLKPTKLWGVRTGGPVYWGWKWFLLAPSRLKRRCLKNDLARKGGCGKAALWTAECESFSTTGTTPLAALQRRRAPLHLPDWLESPSRATSSAPLLQVLASRIITWVRVCPRGTAPGPALAPARVLSANLLTPTSLP